MRAFPAIIGVAMASKTTPKRTVGRKSRSSRAAVQAATTISMALRNLINMAAVTTVSGAVLLGLLAVKHF